MRLAKNQYNCNQFCQMKEFNNKLYYFITDYPLNSFASNICLYIIHIYLFIYDLVPYKCNTLVAMDSYQFYGRFKMC